MKRKQRRKLIWMVAGLVVLLYLGLAVYFHNHFFPKTTLNGRKAGGYTAQKVMDEITEEIHSYQLKIATRDKHTEKISGQDISLEPQWGDEITELVHAQNMFAWPVKIFQKQTLKNTTLVDYDKDKLQTQIDALDCMDADNQTAPENASVSSYDKTEGFTVVGCVMGTTIDAEKMYQAVQEAVEITVKYQGYISRQLRQVEEMKRLERTPLPEGLEYSAIKGLRLEARQKLDRIRPKNLGQASRVSGVSPADVAVLMVYLKQNGGG